MPAPFEEGKLHYIDQHLKACHPTEPKTVWIRYTVHKVPGAEATGSTLFTYLMLRREDMTFTKPVAASMAPERERSLRGAGTGR
ncbi:MAG: hypothetical protein ACR2KQ_05660 [Actinomycetota bacterium]